MSQVDKNSVTRYFDVNNINMEKLLNIVYDYMTFPNDAVCFACLHFVGHILCFKNYN